MGGAPMLGLSRVPFGRKGNLAPSLVSWISLLGWETVTAVIAAYAVLALLASAWHVPPTNAWMLVCLLGVASAALLLGRLGHATIVSMQRYVTWIFGLLTLGVLSRLVMSTHWAAVFAARPGSWLAVGGGVGIVVGLLFTATPLFTGPLAVGILAESSLGYLLGFTVSAGLYAVLGRGLLRQRQVAPAVGATCRDEAVNVA